MRFPIFATHMSGLVPCVLPAFLLLLSGAARAQEVGTTPPDTSQGEQKADSAQAKEKEAGEQEPVALGETVVTATRYPESAFDVPLSTTVVDKQEIMEHNARTPAEALRYKPGIWVQKTGHNGGAPIIRGFMGNRVIYLFDGVRRNTAGLFGGPKGFLQTIDALDIDRIEVVRGPGSVLYGSDAIGGVINVISNEKPLFTDTPDFGGRLYSRFASADRESSTRAEGYFSSPDFYGFVGGTYRDIDDLRGGRGVGVQSPSGWREENFDAQFNYRINDKSSVEFFMQDFSLPSSRRFDKPDRSERTDRELYGLRYRAEEMGFVDALESTIYYHDQGRQRIRDGDTALDRDSRDQTLGFDLQATSFVGDDVRLVYGVHAHRDEITSSSPRKGTRDVDVDWLNPAAFGLAEWQATDRLRLDFGLRWDMFNLKSTAPAISELDQEVQDAINSGALSLSDLELDDTDNALTGGIGAVYALTDDTNLVGHIGRGFRAPTKSDLLRFGDFTFGFNVPSPGVKPESSLTYELGVRTQKENFAGAVTGFYTEIDNAIVSEPGTFNGSTFIDVNGNGVEDPGEAVFKKTNSTGTVRAMGVELEGRQYLPESWSRALVGSNELSWYGNASWIYGEDTGNGEPLDRAYPANALVGFRIDESRNPQENGWWVELETWLVRKFDRINSTRRASDPAFKNDPQDSSSGLIGGNGDLPGFGTINLRGGRRINENATLYVGVDNLTDRSYRVKDSRIDGPGINFVFGLNVSF